MVNRLPSLKAHAMHVLQLSYIEPVIYNTSACDINKTIMSKLFLSVPYNASQFYQNVDLFSDTMVKIEVASTLEGSRDAGSRDGVGMVQW